MVTLIPERTRSLDGESPETRVDPTPGLPRATSDGTSALADLDRAAIAEIVAGRLVGLEELYERHRALVYSIALRVTADRAVSEDVTHDVFLNVWRGADQYAASRASVRTWLMTIVHNRSIDELRRRRPTVDLPDGDQWIPRSLVEPDPWREVAAVLDAAAVRTALGTLPSVQRQAIELSYFGGLTQAEVAAQVGAPIGTVKSRVRVGLLRMRRELEASGVSLA